MMATDNIHREIRSEYLEMLFKNGITNGLDYVTLVTETNESEFAADEQQLLRMVSPAAFYRCYPIHDQDIVLAGLNPHSEEVSGSTPGGALEILAPAVADIETFTRACVQDWTRHYITNKRKSQGFHKVIEYLSEADVINGGEPASDESYFADGDPPPCYQDVYFTNWFKMGTPGGSELSNLTEFDEGIAQRTLRQEMAAIDPALIFISAKDTLQALDQDITGLAVEPSVYGDEPKGFENGEKRDSLNHTWDGWTSYIGYAYEVETMPCPVAVMPHPNRWNQQQTDDNVRRLRDSIETLGA